MADKKTIIRAFLDWFAKDPHRLNEDFYKDTLMFSYLNGLSNEQFIDYFFQFAREGGKIQSQGWRTAPKFRASMIEHFDEFRSRILQMFNKDFNIDDWLNWAGNFKNFGQGLSTIILNRIDKNKYVIVNNKSFEGLQKLGYKVTSVNFFKKYKSIFEAERSLLREFPELNNFYRVDALMHFIIGTEEGKAMLGTSDKQDYFNLDGFNLYARDFGKEYDEKLPAAGWFKDTRMKLEYLVQLLHVRLKENISVNYSERPRGMAGPGIFNLKDYVLTGFSPDNLFPDGELFIKLAFHGLGKDPKFDIEFDINYKLENKPFKEKVEEIKLSTRKRIPVDDKFPKDWDSLLGAIQGHIKSLISEYRKISNDESDIRKPNEPMNSLNSLNTILYGPPGTGKTYLTQALAVAAVKNIPFNIEEEITSDIKTEFRNLIKNGQIVFCTFHQSIGYEDFIEGIKPLPPEPGKSMQYDIIDGIFKKLSLGAESNFDSVSQVNQSNPLFEDAFEKLKEDWENNKNMKFSMKTSGKEYTVTEFGNKSIFFKKASGGTGHSLSNNTLRDIYYGNRETWDKGVGVYYPGMIEKLQEYSESVSGQTEPKNYVLIIDEINRGNVPQIFGEIITLIEEDKRKGRDNAILVTLPYSHDTYTVPPNLYIIGTMNTADRSVEALDTALRRRFSFIEVEPLPGKLSETEDSIDLKQMLETINGRLEILIDKDHTIGHAWLMGVKDLAALKDRFSNKILPLLKEFFYNEYEKIGLVLSEEFIVENIDNRIELSKYKPGGEIASEHKNKKILKLKPTRELTKENFISIYKTNNNTQENKDQ